MSIIKSALLGSLLLLSNASQASLWLHLNNTTSIDLSSVQKISNDKLERNNYKSVFIREIYQEGKHVYTTPTFRIDSTMAIDCEQYSSYIPMQTQYHKDGSVLSEYEVEEYSDKAFKSFNPWDIEQKIMREVCVS